MTVGRLMEAYETCIAKLRKSQSSRRKISLKKVEEANFSKEVITKGPMCSKLPKHSRAYLFVIMQRSNDRWKFLLVSSLYYIYECFHIRMLQQ